MAYSSYSRGERPSRGRGRGSERGGRGSSFTKNHYRDNNPKDDYREATVNQVRFDNNNRGYQNDRSTEFRSQKPRFRGNNQGQRVHKKPSDEGYIPQKPPLSFNETKNLLYSMLDDDYTDNIPLKLLDSQVRILNFLSNDRSHDPELIKTIMKVILKASKNILTEKNFRDLLTKVLGTSFSTKQLDRVISIDLQSNADIDMLKLVISFLKLNFSLLPGIAYDVFYNRVFNLSCAIDRIQMEVDKVDIQILDEFAELKELAEASCVPKVEKPQKARTNIFNDIDPPEDFKSISIFPTSEDLINMATKDVFLRENRTRGSYKSVDHYLDVQFRLMREDFIQPLREGLQSYKSNEKKRHLNIRVYKNVYLINSLPAERLGIIHNMRFDLSRLKKVKWAQSKRFIYGSLLCLSSDNFKTLLFGTIANRDIRDLERGVLSIKFYNSSPNKDEEFILVETTNMFESYRHVLLKLQETNEDNLCMKKYLVFAEDKIALPGYLARNIGLAYQFKSKRILPGETRLEWPRAVDLDMDESQFQAFKSALTNELTIIQGPPGTGKTYLGLNICECLITNVQSKISGFGPILIVCYTNHALDQFLEGISNFTDKIVRIGNRCKSEKLQQFSILNWKKKSPSREFSRQKWGIFGKLKDLKDELIYKQAALNNCQEKLLGLDKLKPIIDDDQHGYLKAVGLRNWLYGESYANDTFVTESSVDTLIEWLMYEEIIQNVQQIVIDAQTDLLREIDEGYDNDLDNEVNYMNDQRKLEVDEDDIGALNNEFERVLNGIKEPEEISSGSNDGFTRVKNKTTERLFKSRLRRKEKMSQERAMQIKSLDTLSIESRWSLYRFWRSKYADYLHESSESLEKEYEELSKQINEIHFEEDRHVMKEQSVIGMTTTGAARYSKVLSLIRCKIIIVEEAAEVLESHIVGSLNPGCEHLILIGDHKQLKPNPAVYELAKRYELDISLFERLINNNMHYNTLALQHRMRPEIAEIMQFIYKDLKDHDSVLNYPHVPSVSKDIFFFDHRELEESNEEMMSYSNAFEAQFIVKFCRHLMKNGVERTKMTILTLYSGQMFLLRQLMDKHIFEGVRVCVVDNYQGEENDIIILSLVRSNEYEKIGFLSIENRICVSLSRAKHGLYVFGNFQILSNQNDMWKKICHLLKRNGTLGNSLVLSCQNHPEKKLVITKANDFDNYPEGGCDELCNQRLECGHACRKACHFLDKNHENTKCMERCTRLCPNGHRCNFKCWQECKQCDRKTEKVIPNCRHKQMMQCSKEPEASDCTNNCERMLICGHICTRKCREKCDVCLTLVEKMSPECGHLAQYKCSDRNIICNKPCESILGCEHKCVGTCGRCYAGRLHETCQKQCKSQLVCGHACTAKCSLHCPPCQRRCEEGCVHNACPKSCGEQCVPCFERCKWACKHKRCGRLCHEPCDRDVCDESCDKMLDCGTCKKRFKCFGICGEPCRKICLNCDPEIREIFFGTEEEPNARFITLWTCHHSFEVTAMDNYMEVIQENGEIVPKKCPKCNSIINKRSCFRYLNMVKKISTDIKNVQKRIVDNLQNVTIQEYTNSLQKRCSKISKMFKTHQIVNYFDTKDNLSPYMILPYKTSLDLMYEIYHRTYSKYKTVEFPKHIHNVISHLIEWLNPQKRKFNSFEISQCETEFDRLQMFLNIHDCQQKVNHMVEIDNFIKELEKIKFTKPVSDEFKARWIKFHNEKMYLPNMQITDYERQEIVKAIGLDKGRWFKCPNGHLYVIGECGGATQIAKCPECDSSIGGEHHRLLGDNRFAPEMDNASQPAWPGTLH